MEEIPSETLGGSGRIFKEILEVIPRSIVKSIQDRALGVPHLEKMLDEIVELELD